MKNLAFLLALFFAMTSYSQDIYIVNTDNELKIINATTYDVTDLFTVSVNEAGYITDIAFGPTGILYGITSNRAIIEIDLVTETFSVITSFPPTSAYTALVCNSDNELFTARYLDQELYKYNLDTGDNTFVSSGISTPGDFTFYKGQLVYPGFLNDYIKSYDGTTIFNIGCSVPLIWTFVNHFEDCNTNTLYALNDSAILYRYDLESEDYEELHDFAAETGSIYGGATTTEYLASACPVEVLQEVSCGLSTTDFNPYGITLAQNPVNTKIQLQMRRSTALTYQIMDARGRYVDQGLLQNLQITTSDLQTGLYFLRLQDSNGINVFQRKIIKK